MKLHSDGEEAGFYYRCRGTLLKTFRWQVSTSLCFLKSPSSFGGDNGRVRAGRKSSYCVIQVGGDGALAAGAAEVLRTRGQVADRKQNPEAEPRRWRRRSLADKGSACGRRLGDGAIYWDGKLGKERGFFFLRGGGEWA